MSLEVKELGSPEGSPFLEWEHISLHSGGELPSAPDTMLQTLEEYPGLRPLLFL